MVVEDETLPSYAPEGDYSEWSFDARGLPTFLTLFILEEAYQDHTYLSFDSYYY